MTDIRLKLLIAYDGRKFDLVPKFHLGMTISAKFHFARAERQWMGAKRRHAQRIPPRSETSGNMHSQVKLGNERRKMHSQVKLGNESHRFGAND